MARDDIGRRVLVAGAQAYVDLDQAQEDLRSERGHRARASEATLQEWDAGVMHSETGPVFFAGAENWI